MEEQEQRDLAIEYLVKQLYSIYLEIPGYENENNEENIRLNLFEERTFNSLLENLQYALLINSE